MFVEVESTFGECHGYRNRCSDECDHGLVYFIQEGVDGEGPIKIYGWLKWRKAGAS